MQTYFRPKNQLIHYKEDRRLSIEEQSILQSFTYEDNNFQWIGPQYQIQQRIGNSVPPNLMKAIASHIRENIVFYRIKFHKNSSTHVSVKDSLATFL